jgi:hypothetical protein
MKRIHWTWSLPIIQLTFALACHIYAPHEYRVEAHRSHGGTLEYWSRHWPSPSGRVSLGINFPALVLNYPLRNEETVIYNRNSEYAYIRIATKDLGFFVCVVLFWYWVGERLDEAQGRNSGRTWPRAVRIAGLTCGVGFGVLTGAYADQMINTSWPPPLQIGAAGFVWAWALTSYFTWRLSREFLTDRIAKLSFLTATIAILLLIVIWIGGPFGATQALGEYLRPVKVERTGLVAICEEAETPPEDLMRAVEAQKEIHHLSIQRVAVCSGFNSTKKTIASSAASDFHRYGIWLPLADDCCTFQFRRHFEVLAPNESGTVVVQAVLIQSRWDFLRLNWNKIHNYWFWPYAPTGM